MNWVEELKNIALYRVEYMDGLQSYEDILRKFIYNVPNNSKISMLRQDSQILEEIVDALFSVSTSEDWRRHDVAMTLLYEEGIFEELVSCHEGKYSRAVIATLLQLAESVGPDVSLYAQKLAGRWGLDLQMIARSIAVNMSEPANTPS